MPPHAALMAIRLPGVLSLAWPWLAVAGLGAAAFYWSALSSLGVAWQRPEYSYGPMVPLITAYMTLRELHHRPLQPDSGSSIPGLMLIGVGLLLGLIGNLAQIADIGTYGFILAIGGVILVMAGPREGLRFWPGWVHLFFMLPLPQFLYLHISTRLQTFSSEIGVNLIDALGIPVFLDGNIIDLGTYQLQVAEACSGLNYLFPMLSFGWLVALLYVGPNWHRAVIFLATIPITILMNAFRIGVIGILVNQYGIEHAEGFLHAFEGWIIFMACTAILYVLAWLLQRFASGGRRYSGVLDFDYRGILGPLKAFPQLRASSALAGASLLIFASGALWQAKQEPQPTMPARESLALFPLQLGEWRGEAHYLDSQTLETLGADDYLNASYAMGEARVELLMTFYLSQTNGQGGIHSPENCLPAGGWEVSQWARKTLETGGNAPQSLTVNRAIIQKGTSRQLVYYWLEQRGRQTPSEYAAKFHTLTDAIATGRSDGGLVRLVTPISPTEDMASAEARLADIIARILPMLPSHFPPS
jgi:exosortase D (VPLPA-CTERM-specific)